MEAILIVLAAILADNLLLSRLFGVESFFTATEKPNGAALYGGLVTAVTVHPDCETVSELEPK